MPSYGGVSDEAREEAQRIWNATTLVLELLQKELLGPHEAAAALQMTSGRLAGAFIRDGAADAETAWKKINEGGHAQIMFEVGFNEQRTSLVQGPAS